SGLWAPATSTGSRPRLPPDRFPPVRCPDQRKKPSSRNRWTTPVNMRQRSQNFALRCSRNYHQKEKRRMMTTSAAVQEFSMFPEDREQEILSEEAVQFLRELDQRFEVRRLELLAARQKRQE